MTRSGTLVPTTVEARAAQLRWFAALFAIAVLTHGADHLRRGMNTVSSTIMALGTTQLILAAVTVVAVFLGLRWAAWAAVAIGFVSALAFAVVHLLPDWLGPFSDSFINAPAAAKVTGFSWFSAVFEILADAAFGIVGLRALGTWRSPRP
ncbi:hypothetical protein ACIP5Y_29115 [Nocardia sp. NPDC088792]|uniref:hypothetical protein n=1 Tax=Nocardia sp. NPDC088792 TaxID=3364332 RepID=UPI00380F6477